MLHFLQYNENRQLLPMFVSGDGSTVMKKLFVGNWLLLGGLYWQFIMSFSKQINVVSFIEGIL